MINTFKEPFTYCVNSDGPADVLIQDVTVDPTKRPPAAFKQIVLLVPWCEQAAQVRLYLKQYRAHYGANKTLIVDVDETFPARQDLILEGKQLDTPNLIGQIFSRNSIEATRI